MELRREDGPLRAELASVHVYAPAPERRAFVGAVVVLLYSVGMYYCVNTSGEAYEFAVEKIRKRNRENFKNFTNKTNNTEKDVLPDDPLPSTWAPSSWAGVLMGTVVSVHIFFHLMCYWRPSFHAATLLKKGRRVRDGYRALATPPEHRGSAALVEIRYSELTDNCVFEFQRMRYEVVVGPREDGEDDGTEEPDMVRRVRCPVDKPLKYYVSKRGLDDDDVDLVGERFGKNLLTVQIPSFMVCYKEQILSPLVVFQLFLSFLWAMDDYLSYTLMQICFILLFESTTVFQRQRTMKMLNGMTIKPFDVKVYRDDKWVELTTSDLLPGDLMQLTANRPDAIVAAEGSENANSSTSGTASGNEAPQVAKQDPNAGVAVVPCDCLLLRGEAVVNEASLTGESVPQMKEALVLEDESRELEMDGVDMPHVLSSGTSPMSTKAGDVAKTGPLASLPETPDGGCLCYVLRTSFSSSQGKLLQMIEFSTDRRAVKADEREMSIALGILLCFALVASAYVFKKGLDKGDKTTYELVLKCVIIVSSVVPRSLPMTMAVAVNTAIMTLLRNGVFCTEPHRVPFGGKLTHCLFDKTGTITTDTLSLEGIVNGRGAVASNNKNGDSDKAAVDFDLEPVRSATPAAATVLGACHSLVSVEGQGLVGDPIELSALRAVGWSFDDAEAVARPCEAQLSENALKTAKAELDKLQEKFNAMSQTRALKEDETKELEAKKALVKTAEDAVEEAKKRDEAHPVASVQILQRYRFLSKLQRSCTVVKLVARQGGPDAGLPSGRYCLVKGSPEAVGALLEQGAAPSWYQSRYRDLAEHGMRVLALALKQLPQGSDEMPSREDAEKDLEFVGFIAFSCRARADSELVIKSLKESAHGIALITGDSPLTALHVARQTGFCQKEAMALVLQVDEEGGVAWAVATGSRRGETQAFCSSGVKSLVADRGLELMVTEAAMRAAVEKEPEFWDQLEHIRVFARMTPQGKADVIRSMQKLGCKVLMCGDGGNDMGALKQADVGLALFSGYGNMNAEAEGEADSGDAAKEAATDGPSQALAKLPETANGAATSEDILNTRQKDLEKKGRQLQKEKQRLLSQKQWELQAKQKEWLDEELRKREAAGAPTGFMGHAAAMKTVMARFTQELIAERKELDKKYGNVYDKKDEDPMKKLMGETEEASAAAGGMPVVRPGDASLAAPFTSRTPSVKNTVDIIRQGRCALLSALQQQQIVMLHCLINAYVLSALSLEGSRTSERQLMASSWLLNTASIAFSYARPCDKMHPVRPLKSLFHPAVFVSLFGQAAIHLGCLIYATSMAREAMDPESEARKDGLNVGPSLPDVSEFWKKQRLIRKGLIEKEAQDEAEMGFLELAMKQWESPFLPNLMNTVVFLVETSQTVAVLAVNYKGQPWMRGLVENRPLFLSVFALVGGMAACAWEAVPEANRMVHLTPFPGDDFRIRIMVLVLISIFGTFIWDRVCVRIFAPDIFKAMWESALQTTFEKDVLPIFMDCGKILLGLGLFCMGVPGWIALFFWWKNRKREE